MPARLQTFLACMYVVACCYTSGGGGSLMAVMTDNAGVHTQALNVVAEQYKNLGKRVHLKHLNAASYKLLDKATMLTNHFQYQQAEEVSVFRRRCFPSRWQLCDQPGPALLITFCVSSQIAEEVPIQAPHHFHVTSNRNIGV